MFREQPERAQAEKVAGLACDITEFLSRIGYQGNKRYLKLRLYGLGTATAVVSALAIMGKASRMPVA